MRTLLVRRWRGEADLGLLQAYKNDLAAARVRQEGYGQQAVSQFAGMAGTAGQVPAGLSGENAKVASNAQGCAISSGPVWARACVSCSIGEHVGVVSRRTRGC